VSTHNRNDINKINSKYWRGFFMKYDIKLSAIISAFITGWIGIIFAINSNLSNNETGAGICLISSALAFGFIIIKN
jgi:hypothetical protein